ncbi:MAG TPA: hypothetical protein VG899_12400 [Mycobacteriales bacterium]|nr:hypothetical protein [Mycobacteriales bacterium]
MARELLIATESFWIATKDGRGEQITSGSLHAADSAVVKAHRDKFRTPEDLAVSPATPTFGPTEQATAAPGEKRRGPRRGTKPAIHAGPTEQATAAPAGDGQD